MDSQLLALTSYYSKVAQASVQFSAALEEANRDAKESNLPQNITDDFVSLEHVIRNVGKIGQTQANLEIEPSLQQFDTERRIVSVLWKKYELFQRVNEIEPEEKETDGAGDHPKRNGFADSKEPRDKILASQAKVHLDRIKKHERRLAAMEDQLENKSKKLKEAMVQNMHNAMNGVDTPAADVTPVPIYWRPIFPEYYSLRQELAIADMLCDHATEVLRITNDRKLYDKESESHLNSVMSYQLLHLDYTAEYKAEIRRILEERYVSSGKELISPVFDKKEALKQFLMKKDAQKTKEDVEEEIENAVQELKAQAKRGRGVDPGSKRQYILENLEGVWIRHGSAVERNDENAPAAALALWKLGSPKERVVRVLYLALNGGTQRKTVLIALNDFFLAHFPIDRVLWPCGTYGRDDEYDEFDDSVSNGNHSPRSADFDVDALQFDDTLSDLR